MRHFNWNMVGEVCIHRQRYRW